MSKKALVIGISLAATVAAAAIVLNAPDPLGEEPVVSTFDDTAATEERIRALEAAVTGERAARQVLEEEMQLLFAEIERLERQAEVSVRDVQASDVEARGRAVNLAEERFQRFRGERSPADREARLVEAGLSPDRAAWIVQREEELRYESMRARFEARNSDNPQAMFDPTLSPDAMLRAEIGDAEYEKYLQANNRSTTVHISNVMASSPGQSAGLQAGDQIVAYDGQRVFSTMELMQQTMQSGNGSVTVDIMRDGAPMQIVVPRGPIGVELGRRR